MIQADIFPLNNDNSDSFSPSKRDSRSLDLPVHPLAGSMSANNSIALRRHRCNSDGGKEIQILTHSIETQSLVPLQDTEASLSAVLPPTETLSHPLAVQSQSLLSPAESTTPPNHNLLFNFGLGTKRLPYRKQSYCTSFLQRDLAELENRTRRGSHFSAFSSFTRASKSNSGNPLKNLMSRSRGIPPADSKYSIFVSTPPNNPEAAFAMHPLNQIGCDTDDSDSSPTSTLKKQPTLPVGLREEITNFAIDGFAKRFFSTHKRGLFRRRVPMNEMIKWSKESIKQPLIMINKELYKDALKCFKVIQMIMGDRARPRLTNEMDDIQFILACGITKGQMRDEIYVQVCKQLHDNPNGDSIRKGWEILCIISVTFPPSKNLESYLTDFVSQSHALQENHVDVFSKHVANKLKKICARGAKGKVLTNAEILRAKEAPFKPSVFGESLSFIMELQQKTDPKLYIPQIVPFLANTVRETNGKCSEGIFRVPGDADAVTELRVRIENGIYDATGITDPNVPASLLKYWLRDLAEPIIATEYYDECIQYADDPEKAISIINGLPETNRRIALFTISFLQEFTDLNIIKDTLMNVNNLAMVFAPNFLRCPSESLTTVFENSKYEQAFLRTLINKTKIEPSVCIYSDDDSKVKGCLQ